MLEIHARFVRNLYPEPISLLVNVITLQKYKRECNNII